MEARPVKVSIITVVYNGERYLERTIASVAAQTYPDIEYIVVDGASTDSTPDIIHRNAVRVDVSISERDNGMYEAMNKGIARACGDIIGIINADDWLEPDAVASAVSLFRDNPGADVVHGRIRTVDDNETVLGLTGEDSSFLDRGMFAHPATFIKADAYRRFGVYNDGMKVAADYELMLRFRDAGAKFVFTPQVFANFTVGGRSTSYRSAVETLDLQYRYRLIPWYKCVLLKAYWRLRIWH